MGCGTAASIGTFERGMVACERMVARADARLVVVW